MNLIKIATVLKNKFSEFYDIKLYRKKASNQVAINQYITNEKKIIVDEEK